MLPFFTAFIIFVIVLNLLLHRKSRTQEEINRNFWEKELASNATRKKDLSQLDYITIPSEKMPPLLHSESEKECIRLSSRPMLNLERFSGTELKTTYGIANLETLSEYENNLSEFTVALHTYTTELIQQGYHKEAIALLEYAIYQGVESRPLYLVLAKEYKNEQNLTKLQELYTHSQDNDSLSGKIITKELASLLEQTNSDS